MSGFQATVEVQLDASVRSGSNQDLVAVLEADVRTFEVALQTASRSIASAAATLETSLGRHRLEIVAKLAGTKVHKSDLGATSDQGFKGISELRHEIHQLDVGGPAGRPFAVPRDDISCTWLDASRVGVPGGRPRSK